MIIISARRCWSLALHPYLLLCIVAAASAARASLLPEMELLDKSFALSGSITIQQYDKSSTVHFDVEELHSAWQGRSKMKYKTRSRSVEKQMPREGTLYADGLGDILLVDVRYRTCSRKDHGFIDRMFNSDMKLDRAEWSQLIGPTRLLAFIGANRNHFSLLNNVGALKFISKHLTEDNFYIIMIYRNVAGENLAHGIPRSILLHKNDGTIVSYEFSRYVPLAENEPRFVSPDLSDMTLEQFELSDRAVDFDLFALERSMGCSRAMRDTTGARAHGRLLTSSLDENRFAFLARLQMPHLREPMTMAVGHEPALSALKVERSSASTLNRILVDYRNGRSYNVQERRLRENDTLFEHVLQAEGDLSCVTSQVRETDAGMSLVGGSPLTLGQMLLGTQRLAYLGLARVRGVEALVYEAHDCEWPFWLEQPTIYRDESAEAATTSAKPGGGGGFYRRQISGPSKGPMRESKFNLTSVFYFSRGEQAHEALLASSLLLIEVFKVTKENQVLARVPIYIYDFSWALNTRAPNDERWEDFFSLADQCLASPSQLQPNRNGQHFHVDLLLENSEQGPPQQVDWLGESTRRNLAVMRSAQEHFLPWPMIFGLESRFLTADRTFSPAHELIAVTMEVAERVRDLAQIVFLAMARVKSGQLIYEKFKIFMAFSMQSCSMLAAHGKRDTLFAFDFVRSTCFILKDETFLASQGAESIIKNVFVAHEQGQLEVYRIEHKTDVKLSAADHLTSLSEHRARLVRAEHLFVTDPNSLVVARGPNADSNEDDAMDQQHPQQAKVSLKIKQFEMSPLGDDNPLKDPTQVGELKKFPGLGLVATDHQNRLISPKGSPSETEHGSAAMLERSLGEMTFARCQSACLVDFQCRSFSTCVLNGQIECIISSVAFTGPFIGQQLVSVAENRKVRFAEARSISLSDDEADNGAPTITVKKMPSCELHNKVYSDLLKPSRKLSISLGARIYRPVANLEECSRMFFDWIVQKFNQSQASATRKSSEQLSNRLFYVDHVDLLEMTRNLESEEHKRAISFLLGDLEFGGYCVFSKQIDDKERAEWNRIGSSPKPINITQAQLVGKATLTTNLYVFDFKLFFEPLLGWSLDQSPKTQNETLAYRKILSEWNGHPEEIREAMETLKSFVERGDNSGNWISANEVDECAVNCLSRGEQIWPACRSFDYIEVKSDRAPNKLHYCAYNTITLRQALKQERFDLIREGQKRVRIDKDSQVRVWHYEPKLGLVSGSLDESYQVSLANSEHSPSQPAGLNGLHLYQASLLSIVIVVVILGMASGFKIAAWSMAKRKRNSIANDLSELVNTVEQET